MESVQNANDEDGVSRAQIENGMESNSIQCIVFRFK